MALPPTASSSHTHSPAKVADDSGVVLAPHHEGKEHHLAQSSSASHCLDLLPAADKHPRQANGNTSDAEARKRTSLAPARDDAAPSSSSTPLEPSRVSKVSDRSDQRSISPPLVTLAGARLWTPDQERLLAAAIQRHGLEWDKVKHCYQDSAGYERTIAALQQQWRCISRRPKPKGVVAAAIKVADAYQRPLRRGMWTLAEVDVLRQGMGQKKRIREICDDYEDKFPKSKRSRRAVQAKIEQMRADDKVEANTHATLRSHISVHTHHPSTRASYPGHERSASPPLRPHGRQPDYAAGMFSNNPHAWSQHDVDLLLATVPRYYTGTIQWQKVTARFNLSSDKKRSDRALAARWHALGYTNEDAQRLAEGRGGRAIKSEQPRLTSKVQRRHQARVQTYEEEPDNGGVFSTAEVSHQGVKQDGHAPFHLPSTSRPQPLPTSTSLMLSPLNVKITYEPEGIRLEGVFPGLEIMVFSPTCVKITTTGQDTAPGANQSFEEIYPAFHLKCVELGGVQAVVVPPGTTMSATLVRAPAKTFAAGVRHEMSMQTSVRGPDDFLVLIS